MIKKRLFLSVLAIGTLLPNNSLYAILETSDQINDLVYFDTSHIPVCKEPWETVCDLLRDTAKAALMMGVASAGVYGIYKVGEWCDLWGGPNLQHVLKKAKHIYNATKEYDKMLDLYEACVEHDHFALQSYGIVKDKNLHAVFLKSLAAENIIIDSVAFWVHELQEEEAALLSCLQYADKSSRYSKAEINELSFMHGRVQSRVRILRSFLKDLEMHKSYFALYAGEKRLAEAYAQERALFNRYASQANTLKAELYAIAARAYLHAWSIVDYAQQLNADITCLAKLIDENRSLDVDMASACQLYETLSAIHTLIITDRVFVDTAEQYIGWKEEQIHLRHEQERIEQQRRDAERERRRSEAARVAAERERRLACDVHAGYQYANGYYNGKADASWQTYEAQQQAKRAKEKAERLERERKAEARRAEEARNDARRHQQNAEYERAKADRERAEKERLAQERDAENRRKREREEQQRQERKRQEQEAARREAERQESLRKKAAEREAREREEAEARRRREREEQQRQERKRKEIEAEKAAAQREADRKLEEVRYNTFDRFQ